MTSLVYSQNGRFSEEGPTVFGRLMNSDVIWLETTVGRYTPYRNYDYSRC
ncbi:hypothetical protein Lepto7375DRAFT_0690 [Leptolyngbya sp. PCC 7375]|nr:hypothetical protein Lepto7375DRAFT_0690 [Leptolyngbya sp. PCC 7375]